MTELLLFNAARRCHIQQTIRPQLALGTWVICERFFDSSVAFQSYGRSIPRAYLDELHAMYCFNMQPDLTFILDCPIGVGQDRIRRRGAMTRFDRDKTEFHDRVRQGYMEIG